MMDLWLPPGPLFWSVSIAVIALLALMMRYE